MRSATLPRIESPAAATIGNGYQRLSRATRQLHKRLVSALRAKRDEQYVMNGEELLRGPLSDEIRRAPWL